MRSTPIRGPGVSTTARSMTFSSSRTLPGQSYSVSRSSASGISSRSRFRFSSPYFSRKWWTSSGMSSFRSRSGGSEPPLGWGRVRVIGWGDELLAGAALPLEENRRAARRRLNDQIEHLPHPRALADDVRELVIPLLDVLPQIAVLVDEPPALHRVADDHQHFVVLERLRDVVERAGLHRRDGALDGCERRNDDDGEVLVDALQLVERRDAVETRHHDVDDGRVEGQRPRELEPFLSGCCQADVVAFARQQRFENLTHDFLVVDDEDGAVSCCTHISHIRLLPDATRALLARSERKRQRKPRALIHDAVAADRAVVLAHDAVCDRETQPGAAADCLGREER